MLPYRRCVSIVLTKKCKNIESRSGFLVFVAERLDLKNAWQMPQGGVNSEESYEDAARRELLEETGIKNVKFVSRTKNIYKYDFPEQAQKDMMNKYGYLKYAGQEVCFVRLEFIGDESEIDLDHDTKEFVNWKWTTPEEVLNSIIEFKYSCYLNGFIELGIL